MTMQTLPRRLGASGVTAVIVLSNAEMLRAGTPPNVTAAIATGGEQIGQFCSGVSTMIVTTSPLPIVPSRGVIETIDAADAVNAAKKTASAASTFMRRGTSRADGMSSAIVLLYSATHVATQHYDDDHANDGRSPALLLICRTKFETTTGPR